MGKPIVNTVRETGTEPIYVLLQPLSSLVKCIIILLTLASFLIGKNDRFVGLVIKYDT